MTYKFISKFNGTYQDLPGVKFVGFSFVTEDASIAAALRKKRGVIEITEKTGDISKITAKENKEKSGTLASDKAVSRLDEEARAEIERKIPKQVKGQRTSQTMEGKKKR